MSGKFVLLIGCDPSVPEGLSQTDSVELRHCGVNLATDGEILAIFSMTTEDAHTTVSEARDKGVKAGFYQDEDRAVGFFESAMF